MENDKNTIVVMRIIKSLRSENRPVSTKSLCEMEDVTIDEMTQILEQLESAGYLQRYNSDFEKDTDGDYWHLISPQSQMDSVIGWLEDMGLLDREPGDDLSDVEKLAHIVDLASWVDESPHPERTQLRAIEQLQDKFSDKVKQ